jgi:hypothetical protein
MRIPKDGISRVARVAQHAGRVLTGRQLAGRNLTVFPDDVFLVSYPRSGNTWTRFLISNLIYQDTPTTFVNIESRIPEIYFNPDHKMRALERPRILKSHECFQPHYKRIIYIVRDPRDVAVSFYHHNVKAGNIPEDYAMDDFIPRFISAEFDSRWGSWEDSVISWLTLRQGQPTFLMVRYEDMKEDAQGQLLRVADFLRQCSFRTIDSRPEQLDRAVDLSSPERMRSLEKEQGKNWVLTQKTRLDKPFVRSAKSGGWKSTLSERAVSMIESAWGGTMRALGYELVGDAPTSAEKSSLHQSATTRS